MDEGMVMALMALASYNIFVFCGVFEIKYIYFVLIIVNYIAWEKSEVLFLGHFGHPYCPPSWPNPLCM